MGGLSSLQSLVLSVQIWCWEHYNPTMTDGTKREKKQHRTLSREFPMRCTGSGTGREEINKLMSLCVHVSWRV